MTSLEQEKRRQTEAREWLRRTQGDPVRIRELLKRIEHKRGKEAAEILRADMRIAYQVAKSTAAMSTQADR